MGIVDLRPFSEEVKGLNQDQLDALFDLKEKVAELDGAMDQVIGHLAVTGEVLGEVRIPNTEVIKVKNEFKKVKKAVMSAEKAVSSFRKTVKTL